MDKLVARVDANPRHHPVTMTQHWPLEPPDYHRRLGTGVAISAKRNAPSLTAQHRYTCADPLWCRN
jgi:hypothetical protein